MSDYSSSQKEPHIFIRKHYCTRCLKNINIDSFHHEICRANLAYFFNKNMSDESYEKFFGSARDRIGHER